MKVITTAKEMANYRALHEGSSIGFVPTMGALHDGHCSLIKCSRSMCDVTIVSIFVNPKQFAPNEDYDEYPRQFEIDIQRCEHEQVDAVFLPSTNEVYPENDLNKPYIPSKTITTILCGVSRPHFFDGVCAVVQRLFEMICPSRAFFGNKDLQQRCVIEQMVADLNLSIDIIGCPIVRDEHGLAKSSRNQYLTGESYEKAIVFPETLQRLKSEYKSGCDDIDVLKSFAIKELMRHSLISDYIEFFDPIQKSILTDRVSESAYCCAAVICDGVRLIDNCSMKI